jgi:hypothetical protein
LSVISTNTVVLKDGFNSDNSGSGAMVVSPRIEVESSTAANIGAFVVTGAINPRYPFFHYNSASPSPEPTITGGLAVFQVPGRSIASDALSTKVVPSVGYLQGTVVPPAVPSCLDFRISQEDIQVYTMFATP